ncbi:hypothetical protein RJ639_032955 [Escallonia herrerae]|uniref:DYW domain-containing protein n=1 Tax=Escallonia herrerae TaxID=1293975 RepID=A0AA89BB61_9ASTE|nr:hypothetical protein RJ639_032955 [Escallonia herrerae]
MLLSWPASWKQLTPHPTFIPNAFFSTETPPPLAPSAIANLLRQCSSLAEAKRIHQQLTVSGLASADPVGVVRMYVACGAPAHALRALERLHPSPFSVYWWNALIRRSVRRALPDHVLHLYLRMQRLGWKPDGQMRVCGSEPNVVTLVSVLSACASVGALPQGKETHCYAVKCVLTLHKNNHCDDLMVTNALIDIHSGMVDQGIGYFNSMARDYGVVPGVEHYACMVDLLGRAGRLDEAVNLIKGMPVEPSPIVWVALLSACRTHKNVELGEFASSQLLELEAENDGSYTLLSNIYANARRWKDVAKIRSLMKHTGIKKRPGCSWVQGKKGTATFFVGDRSHPLSQHIYDLLVDLIHRIKALGYVPETSFALHDVDDEEKSDLLSEHSEKLALAYGILTSAPGIPIRITKNLRVCGDCHTAITYISKIIEHEVILRDSSRFHHFKNGYCSCRGYW